MTRRKLVMGQRSQEEGNNSTMWELPTHWTAAQALAVFEVLDDLRDLVVDGYARKIQQAARLDRTWAESDRLGSTLEAKKGIKSMKLLIIEDNADIVANLYEFLIPRGYSLDNARTAPEGLLRVAAERFDAIVVDVMLPGGMDGFALCNKIRKDLQQATPMLILTARDNVEDKLRGFDSGADDYLVKPFSMVELDARVKSLVRRASGAHGSQRLIVGELIFGLSTFELTRAGTQLGLTPTGYKLLACLMRAAPNVVTREQLERAVWGDDPPDSDALRTHLHSLRQVIDKPFAWPMLKTIAGVGYRLMDQP